MNWGVCHDTRYSSSDSHVINHAYMLLFPPTFELSSVELGVTLTQLGLLVGAAATDFGVVGHKPLIAIVRGIPSDERFTGRLNRRVDPSQRRFLR